MLTIAPPLLLRRPSTVRVRGFVQWLRRHRGAVAMAGLLAYAGPLTFFAGALSVMRAPHALNVARLGLWWIAYGACLWCLLLISGNVCDQLVRGRARATAAYIWLAGACVAAVLTNLITAGRAPILLEQGLIHSPLTMHLHGFVFSLVMALIYFTHLRRTRGHEQATARLAAAQSAQRQARQRIVHARLQELQARIDPQILFEMLGAVRGLYERDPEQAERFFDELIAFLRAALPRLRTASSSLVREVELARTYVGLHLLAGRTDLSFAANIAPETIHARFPSGVLLPLLDTALRTGRGPCRLTATRSGDSCRVVLSVPAAPSEEAVSRARSLMSELHGTASQLDTAEAADGSTLVAKVPYELA